MIEIPRHRLVDELVELTRRGSVMVSGAPGVGKSWVLGQLVKRCKKESRRVTTLAAEDFQVSTLQQIYDALKFTKPLPKLLAALSDPVLIIDGLDALRGEASQRAFRELIRQVSEQAPNAAVVASVRTFDLQESPELQRLQNRYSGTGRGMQRFVIGELTDIELLEASGQSSDLLALLENRSTPLFNLLRNPFNLHLAFALLSDGISLAELRTVQSQVQLLESYWRYRVLSPVEGSLKEKLLTTFTKMMVDAKTLSVPESDITEPGYQEALHSLKSSEVLRKSTTGRLAYAHNILFDYAISRLLLDEYRLFDFVREDPARSLFFRPSLTLFFNRLWIFDPETFWKITINLLSSADLPERMRVVPAVVVSEAAKTADELEPDQLQVHLGPAYTNFISLLLRAALAVRVLDDRRRLLWLQWMLRLSAGLQIEWINEILTALTTAHVTMTQVDRSLIGELARNILFWEIEPPPGLSERQALNLSSVATGRILPIIADTFDSDPMASERAILAISDRIGSPQSASNEGFWLTNILPAIIRKSPSLAERICLQLYSFSEESEESTSMGGGIIMSFRSTRKQDYSSSLYGLTSRFGLFLEVDGARAARVAIQATELEVPRARKKELDQGWEKVHFKLHGRMVLYQADYSEIWDGVGSRDLTSLTLLDSALQFACGAPEELRAEMIAEVITFASLGISWKRLMFRTKLHPEKLYQMVKELLFAPKFISAPEVTVEVGEVLKAAYEKELVSPSDSEKIQRAILLVSRTKFVRRYERASNIQQRLLGCMPEEAITNADLLRVLAHSGVKKKRENKPFIQMSGGAVPFNLTDEYRRAGIDPDTESNAKVIALTGKVREFEGGHLNSIPSDADGVAVEPFLRELHELVKAEGVSGQVAENGRGVLYAAVNVICRNSTLGADSGLIQLCREYAVEGSKDPEPIFDPKYHLRFDHPGWGSPSPRIEAIQALAQLIWNYYGDDMIVSAFLKASTDEVPAVRFQVARYLTSLYKRGLKDQFWTTLSAMIAAESTSGVMIGLLNSLPAVAGLEPERAMQVVEEAVARRLPETERSEMRRALVNVPVGLYAVQGTERAKALLQRMAANPSFYSSEISDAIFTASHYLDPKKTADETQRSRGRELIGFLFEPARHALINRTELKNDPETNRKLLEILDSAGSRIVFSFGLPSHGVAGDDVLDTDERTKHYLEVKPLLEQLLGKGGDDTPVPLTPQTAYYLLQLMNGIIDIDPVNVLGFASAVCAGGSIFGFELDASARDEAVKLVDRALADHRDTLKSSAASVGHMLDLFVKAGWSEALALTFRLDEAFR
jgi:hypothetical protein